MFSLKISASLVAGAKSVYEIVSKRTGYLELIKENDRLIQVLRQTRNDLDFGVKDAWKNEPVSYKGCEPLITGKLPVHCNNFL